MFLRLLTLVACDTSRISSCKEDLRPSDSKHVRTSKRRLFCLETFEIRLTTWENSLETCCKAKKSHDLLQCVITINIHPCPVWC